MTAILSSKVARAMRDRLLADASRAPGDGRALARTLAKDPRYARRGVELEERIITINLLYRRYGIALVEKVPTEWLPIRDRAGRVVSAKVTRRAPVDFVGVYGGVAIAFDAKSTREARVRWDRIEEHQAEWLKDWVRAGGKGFVLVAAVVDKGTRIGKAGTIGVRTAWWFCPWDWWWHGLNLWQQGEGPASFKVEELRDEWKVPEKGGRVPMDYLSVVGTTCGKEAPDCGSA